MLTREQANKNKILKIVLGSILPLIIVLSVIYTSPQNVQQATGPNPFTLKINNLHQQTKKQLNIQNDQTKQQPKPNSNLNLANNAGKQTTDNQKLDIIDTKITSSNIKLPSPPAPAPTVPSIKPPANTNITGQQVENAKRFLEFNQEIQDEILIAALLKQQYEYYQQKYNISKYQQLPICVVVPSFNNKAKDRYLHNLNSIMKQNYTNFHVVFFNDASTDGTGIAVQNYIKTNKIIPEKFVYIQNQKQMKALPNLRRAAMQFCKDQDVFIIVDGDDQLIGRQVFKLYSAVMQQNNIWFLYSNFWGSRKKVGYSRPFRSTVIQYNKYRTSPFYTSHLRAFYTKLFKLIDDTDLRNQDGNYFQAANDVAICLPILQMSGKRIKYLPELTYYYDAATGLNNHKLRLKLQKSNDKYIRKSKKAYKPLQTLFPQKKL